MDMAATQPGKTAFRVFHPMVAIAVAMWIMAALVVSMNNSATSDELCHLGDGLAVIHYGDFRMNPEHPPIIKVLSALPVYMFLRPPFETYEALGSFSPWRLGYQTAFGYATLFKVDSTPAQYRLFVARLVPLTIGLLGGVAAWIWGRRLGRGKIAGACAAFFLLFYPEYIGNAGFVTFDVPLLVACAFVSAAAWSWYRRPGMRSGSAYVIACCLAPFVKTPGGVFVLAMSALVALFPYFSRGRVTTRHTLLLAGAVAVGLFVTVWSVYGFRRSPMPAGAMIENPNPLFPPLGRGLSPGVRSVVNTAYEWGIVPEASLSLIAHLGRFASRDYFLNGVTSTQGWYYYFAETFLLKSTPAILVGCVLLIVAGVRGLGRESSPRRWRLHPVAVLWFPFCVLAMLTIISRINYGHRYILFLYFPLSVALGVLCARWIAAGGARKIGAIALMVAHFVSFGLAYPNFSTYFNFLTGTPYKALPYLRENNTDWGQDVARLGKWVRTNNVTKINLALYGLNSPTSFFMPDHVWINPEQIYPVAYIKAQAPDRSVPTAISVNELPMMRKIYPGLYDSDPDIQINSIVIYLPRL